MKWKPWKLRGKEMDEKRDNDYICFSWRSSYVDDNIMEEKTSMDKNQEEFNKRQHYNMPL